MASSSSHLQDILELKNSSVFFFLLVLLLGTTLTSCRAQGVSLSSAYDTSTLNRTSFPKGFVFGSASSSYQYEGAASEDGKGPSIWDVFTHKYPEKITGMSNGDVAVNQYHKYKEDVGFMRKIGLDAYRFSISWPRLLPKGKLSGGVNRNGVDYYNNLINELLLNGIQPYVTLLHWDLPQALQDEYGGFLSSRIVDDFKDYVDLVFKEFGDRVKNWITMNEPYMYSCGGYATGTTPPGRCSTWQQLNCTGGDSATEPYLVSHYQLLAHAAAVKLYRAKYQASQKGKIGIALVAPWFEPYSKGKKDRKATSRAMDFELGWFLDPIVFGDYPRSMQSLVGNRLPRFTKEQALMLKGSYDYFGLNYYSASYARDSPNFNNTYPSYLTDSRTTISFERNGMLIGPQAGSSWLHVYPKGIRKVLVYVKKKYGNPLVYITENGVDEANNPMLPLQQQLNDTWRIDYHYHHLSYLRRAIKDGVNAKAYFVWTFLDDFEWASGYTIRFGLNFVDYKNGLKRYAKRSSIWFKSFLKK